MNKCVRVQSLKVTMTCPIELWQHRRTATQINTRACLFASPVLVYLLLWTSLFVVFSMAEDKSAWDQRIMTSKLQHSWFQSMERMPAHSVAHYHNPHRGSYVGAAPLKTLKHAWKIDCIPLPMLLSNSHYCGLAEVGPHLFERGGEYKLLIVTCELHV